MANHTSKETSDNASALAKFGKLVSDKAKELTAVIASDLGTGLAPETAAGQNKVIASVAGAQDEIREGLSILSAWKTLEAIRKDVSADGLANITNAVTEARATGIECLELFKKSEIDTKFRMKAVAAQWHAQHHGGDIVNCPLCDNKLTAGNQLVDELEALRSAGHAATRLLEDNVNAIIANLNTAIPSTLRHIADEILAWEPRKALIADLQQAFVTKERYSKILIKFAALVEDAMTDV